MKALEIAVWVADAFCLGLLILVEVYRFSGRLLFGDSDG